MVISWTRLLGTARVTIHTHDDALARSVEHALRDQAQISVERGIHRRDIIALMIMLSLLRTGPA